MNARRRPPFRPPLGLAYRYQYFKYRNLHAASLGNAESHEDRVAELGEEHEEEHHEVEGGIIFECLKHICACIETYIRAPRKSNFENQNLLTYNAFSFQAIFSNFLQKASRVLI